MTPEDLKKRTTEFGISAVKFCAELRQRPEARNIADQLSASATAVSANYRSACRARSRREFISKLAVALEEADESVGWLEIAAGAGLGRPDDVRVLSAEAREIVAILAASRRTAERKQDGVGRLGQIPK
jgi:four helix bundle protein